MRLMTQVAVLGCWAADWPPGSSMATASASPSSRAAGLSSEAPSVRGSGMVHAPVGGWSSRVRVAPVVERVEKRPAPCGRREAVTITSKVRGYRRADPLRRWSSAWRRARRWCSSIAAALRAELDQARALLDDARNQLVPGAPVAAGRHHRRAAPETLEAMARQAEGRVRQAEARLEELHVAAPFAGRWGCGRVTRAR